MLRILVVLSLICYVICGDNCLNEEKSKRLQQYVSTKFGGVCTKCKVGSKPSHTEFAKKLLPKLLGPDLLTNNVKLLQSKQAIINAALACNKDCTSKPNPDYCKEPTQKCFKDCIIPALIPYLLELQDWMKKQCPNINMYVVEKEAQTKKKIDGYFNEWKKHE